MALRQIVFLRQALLSRHPQLPNNIGRSIRTGKKSSTESSFGPTQSLTPFEGPPQGFIDKTQIWKAFAFSCAFGTGSFAAVSIWEYEKIRNNATRIIRGGKNLGWIKSKIQGSVQGTKEEVNKLQKQLETAWNKLSPGNQVFIPIAAINAIVFALWRVPRFQPSMIKYFCSNPAAKAICWPMVFSTFSHYSLLHICANMYVLHSFSDGAVHSMGKEQFLGFYLTAGVFSSFASHLYKAVVAQPGLSLGASGAIMGILAYICTKYPDTQLSLLFLPMYTFSAGSAIKVIMGIDLAGVLMGWKFFDHAAHLGGAVMGLFWCYYGSQHVWPMREHFIGYWHKFRGPITRT